MSFNFVIPPLDPKLKDMMDKMVDAAMERHIRQQAERLSAMLQRNGLSISATGARSVTPDELTAMLKNRPPMKRDDDALESILNGNFVYTKPAPVKADEGSWGAFDFDRLARRNINSWGEPGFVFTDEERDVFGNVIDGHSKKSDLERFRREREAGL